MIAGVLGFLSSQSKARGMVSEKLMSVKGELQEIEQHKSVRPVPDWRSPAPTPVLLCAVAKGAQISREIFSFFVRPITRTFGKLVTTTELEMLNLKTSVFDICDCPSFSKHSAKVVGGERVLTDSTGFCWPSPPKGWPLCWR